MPKPSDQNCSICKYFIASPVPTQGYCVRFPPPGPIIDSAFITSWVPITGNPAVDINHWCGEYKVG